jgi:hypothetical protein
MSFSSSIYSFFDLKSGATAPLFVKNIVFSDLTDLKNFLSVFLSVETPARRVAGSCFCIIP